MFPAFRNIQFCTRVSQFLNLECPYVILHDAPSRPFLERLPVFSLPDKTELALWRNYASLGYRSGPPRGINRVLAERGMVTGIEYASLTGCEGIKFHDITALMFLRTRRVFRTRNAAIGWPSESRGSPRDRRLMYRRSFSVSLQNSFSPIR